ncbi:hypothetical protein GCM10009836_59220 [Pseudonocardia ailaonensis]|uniref:Uncharacterized protein n=1 Tax=Pseudonocardia ailaonensis TaxID=367279 RepID=A0ABN2NJ14_9PSEU
MRAHGTAPARAAGIGCVGAASRSVDDIGTSWPTAAAGVATDCRARPCPAPGRAKRGIGLCGIGQTG